MSYTIEAIQKRIAEGEPVKYRGPGNDSLKIMGIARQYMDILGMSEIKNLTTINQLLVFDRRIDIFEIEGQLEFRLSSRDVDPDGIPYREYKERGITVR
jgi:hypothetical protein